MFEITMTPLKYLNYKGDLFKNIVRLQGSTD